MPCRLCSQDKPIRDSHIIPRSIRNWVLRTSVTGHMRSSNNPNKRIQDIFKRKLLCDDCEKLFKDYEDYFLDVIFKPIMNSYSPIINYNDKLLKFIVSISWRVLVVSLLNNERPWKNIIHKQAAKKTDNQWKDYLLNNCDLNGYEHHLLMLRRIKDVPDIEGTDVNINWYFFRSVDATIVQNSHESFVYTKIPGFALISPLQPSHFTHTNGTLVTDSGTLDIHKQTADNSVFEFLFNRASHGLSSLKKMNNKERDKINKAYSSNIDRIRDSFMSKLYLAEAMDNDERVQMT